MRSRRPGSWWPLGDTRVSGRRVTCKAPLWPTWKEGQAAPRRRPQPSSRILTAWKVSSAKFAKKVPISSSFEGCAQPLPGRKLHMNISVGLRTERK